VLQHEIPTVGAVVFIKGLVGPGQRVTDKPYEPWLCLDKTHGYVIAAHCNCTAGLGECCSHVAAILFAIEAVTCSGVNSDEACTSVKRIWSKYHKNDVVPSRAEDLDLSHPHHGFTSRKKRRVRERVPELTAEEVEQQLDFLKDVCPEAAACCKSDGDTDTAPSDAAGDYGADAMYPATVTHVIESIAGK